MPEPGEPERAADAAGDGVKVEIAEFGDFVAEAEG
jgi:hypothetical protein